MTRASAKERSLGILARWLVKAVEKERFLLLRSVIGNAPGYMTPENDLPRRPRNAMLRALNRPVRL